MDHKADESELRAAVHAANNCSDAPGENPTFDRIIWFKGHTSGSTCTVELMNNNAAALATCPGLVEEDHLNTAICLRGHHIIVFGNKSVRFIYTGAKLCNAAVSSDGPPAFVLAGEDSKMNGISSVETRFFPEGIDIYDGTENFVESLISDYYCDEAVTVNHNAVNASVHTGLFRGAIANTNCYNGPDVGYCGGDKAIELLGGTSTVLMNTFVNARIPIEALGGTRTIQDNTINGLDQGTCGLPFTCTLDSDEYCDRLEFSGSSTVVTVTGNKLNYCKAGILAKSGATVTANSNIVKDAYDSAFRVQLSGTLIGSGNWIKGAGWFNDSDCLQGGLVVWDNTNPGGVSVDFSNGNVFCQKGANSRDGNNHKDVLNLKNDGASCTHAANFSVRVANNCFDNGLDKFGPTDPNTAPNGNCNCGF